MNLCFAEHDYQAEDLLNKTGHAEYKWIALGPSAMHYLAGKGIPYTVPEDYCSRQELDEICIAYYEKLAWAVGMIDGIILDRDEFLREWGVRPFLFYQWQLAQVCDALVARTIQLQRIMDRYEGCEVYIHKAPEQPWSLFGIGFSQEETLWGRVLGLNGWKNKIHVLPQPATTAHASQIVGEPNARSIKEKTIKVISSIVKENSCLDSCLLSARDGYWKNIAHIANNACSALTKAIGLTHLAYEWSEIMPDISRLDHPFYVVRLQEMPTKQMESEINGAPASLWDIFRNVLNGFSVDIASVLKDRFEFIVATSKSSAGKMIAYYERLFVKNRIRLLLTVSRPSFGSYVLRQYCWHRGIPVISWQHGAEWCDKHITQRYDLINLIGCNTLCVAGDTVRKGYEMSPFLRNNACSVVATGLPSLNKLKDIRYDRTSKSIRILWVFGGYYGNGWYCGFSPPFSDRLYYKEQMLIVGAMHRLLRTFPDMELTIKLYPSEYINDQPPWIPEFEGVNRVSFVYKKPDFVELLHRHDAVIVDSPTTTLLQSAATKLPIFVSMANIRWPEAAQELLRKRACCADSADVLIEALEGFISNGAYPYDVDNVEFLKEYGIHDGNSGGAVISFIKEYLNGEKRAEV